MASLLVLVLGLGSLATGCNASLSSLLTLFGQQPAEPRVTHTGPRITEWLVDLGPKSYNHLGSSVPRLVNPEPSGSSAPNITHSAGYFRLNGTHDTRMFYFYFSQRVSEAERSFDGPGVGAEAAADAPLVLWMTGGPGCSSEVALFFENGPFTIDNDNKSLSWNPYGWDLVSNIIYVDQPVNTGFSYSKDPRDVRHDENGISHDVYEFLQAFLGAHPELRDRPFFVTGESYGGHYVPAVAHRIMKENDAGTRARINLQGLAVGNGLTHPVQQYGAYADFALLNNLITPQQHKTLHKAYLPCKLAAKTCGEDGFVSCYVAFYICESYFSTVFLSSGSGNLNPYDIREDCAMGGLCYDMSAADKFLGQPAVRKALGVPEFVQWKDCSQGVYMAMIKDFMRDLEPQVTDLVNAGIRTLVYAGDKDYICNWLGNWRWVRDMGWSGHDEFIAASRLPFKATSGNSSAWGEAVEAGALSFLRVYDAGHMVPMNKPEAALEMLRRFIHGVPLGDKAAEGKATKHWARAEAETEGEGELKTLRLQGSGHFQTPATEWKGLAGMLLGGDMGSVAQALGVDSVEELVQKYVKGEKEEDSDKDDNDDDDEDEHKEEADDDEKEEADDDDDDDKREHKKEHHHKHGHKHGHHKDDDDDDDDDAEKRVHELKEKNARMGHEGEGVASKRMQEWVRMMGGKVGVQEYERRMGVESVEHHEKGPKGRKVKCHHKQRKGLALGHGYLDMWNQWVQRAHKCIFGAGHKAEEPHHEEGHDESH